MEQHFSATSMNTFRQIIDARSSRTRCRYLQHAVFSRVFSASNRTIFIFHYARCGDSCKKPTRNLMNASFGAQRAHLNRICALIFRPETGKAMLALVGFLPAMALLADIHRFAVNVPFMDDWQFVPLLEKVRNDTLTFRELWAPHDEHRLLLPPGPRRPSIPP